MPFINESLIETCEFCIEFRDGRCSWMSPPRSRVLYENGDFVVFPSLGPFIEGYLLVCPKAHIPSCASLTPELLSQLDIILNSTKEILKNAYQRPILFEHGLASCRLRAGGCIDHAHIHVVPANVNLVDILQPLSTCQELVNWMDLADWKERPYVLVQNIEGPVVVAAAPDDLPSQFLRRKIATAVGLSDCWDWGAYLGLRELDETLRRTQSAFSKLLTQAVDGELDLSQY